MFYVIKAPYGTLASKGQQSFKTMMKPESCTGGHRGFGIQMLVLLFVFTMFVMGGEQAFGKFIYSYSRSRFINFNAETATVYNSVWWIGFTLARFVAFGMTRFLSVQSIMLAQIVGTIVSCIMMNVFYNNPLGFGIFCLLFGFCRSPLYPTTVAWGNRYMEITAMVIGLMNIGSGLGGLVIQWLTGYLFQNAGPRTLLYSSLSLTFIVAFIYVIMQYTAYQHGTRPTATEESFENTAPCRDIRMVTLEKDSISKDAVTLNINNLIIQLKDIAKDSKT